MKKQKHLYMLSQWQSIFFMMLFICLLTMVSCGKEELSQDAMDINQYILSLEYSPEELLNFQNTSSGNTDRKVVSMNNSSTNPVKGEYMVCEETKYQLDKNFDKVNILRPTNGVIWPGALVYGDEDMLDGLPRPVTLDRAPVSLRLDLPGMGEEGNLLIEDPKNTSIQTAINQGLEWWNNNEFQEGYVNPSLSEYQSSVSYSSEQLSLDVGLNAEWASGSLEAQLDYNSSSETQVAVMVFKQVFYSVTMDTPDSPAEVFSDRVSLTEVQSTFDNSTPPAYVSSVDYGRIIMFRMEAKNVSSDINLSAVLEYASGVSASGTANAEYDKVLNSSSTNITAITLGGNAEVASEIVSSNGIASLNHIITGKNAVYGKDNPGIPIAYTIQYLKDNSVAKMGYSTDYTIGSCVTKLWDHTEIRVKNKFELRNIRVKLVYKDKNDKDRETGWQTIPDKTFEGDKLDDQIPDGAYDVKMYVEKFGLISWNEWKNYNLSHVDPSEDCWEAYYNGAGDQSFRKCPN